MVFPNLTVLVVLFLCPLYHVVCGDEGLHFFHGHVYIFS